jgi:hypothetical protein
MGLRLLLDKHDAKKWLLGLMIAEVLAQELN